MVTSRSGRIVMEVSHSIWNPGKFCSDFLVMLEIIGIGTSRSPCSNWIGNLQKQNLWAMSAVVQYMFTLVWELCDYILKGCDLYSSDTLPVTCHLILQYYLCRFGIVTQVIFSLCIFVSYGLQFFVPMEIIGSSLNHTYIARKVGPSIFNYLLRTFFVLLTCELLER